MKELNVAIVISVILLVIGGVAFYFDSDSWEFNFHRAELTINGFNVSEKLYYTPNEPYHTLYRTFQDPAFNTEAGLKNYILINKVECEKGTAYLRNYDDFCVYFGGTKDVGCLPYTEGNEYGCTFGGQYGFFEGNDYWIETNYQLKPTNLFKVNGKNYAKFVVYSPGNHKKLGSNFVTSPGVVRKDVYYPNENVIVYIPYGESAVGFNVFTLNDFEFDQSNRTWKFLFAIFPGFLFFGLWYFFGKEKTHTDFPSEMSFYPRERKPWQIAAFFNPPFSVVDKNFIAATLMEFYHRKIVDVKLREKKQVLIKLNPAKDLDAIEKKFYDILVYLRGMAKESNLEGEYFNLQKVSRQLFIGPTLGAKFRDLQRDVQKEGKNYLSRTVVYFSFLGILLIFVMFNVVGLSLVFAPFVAFLIFYMVARGTSSLFIRFKGGFYEEYQHWQGFRKWLKGSFAMKHEGPEAVKLWDHYLVYSTALGVSEKVIKELKARHLISEKDYGLYRGMHYSSVSFATASGTGGHGGAGGGGVGGGGGGGR